MLIWLTWLIMAMALAAMVVLSDGGRMLLGDDAMRMVEATDLLNGQAWTDTTQYRDNTPYGASMHWSRLIDAPLVGLMIVFKPLFGSGAADAAAFVWPLLVLLGVIALLAALTERLVGKAGRIPILVLTAMALPIYSEFYPGRVDHHNVQTLLALAVILSTIAARTSLRWSIIAGIAAATTLAIGTESIPVLLACLIAVPIFWVLDPANRGAVLAFAASFGLASLAHFLAVTSPSAYLGGACDALSLTYVSAAGMYGLAIIAALSLGRWLTHPLMRFAALAVSGVLIGGTTFWFFPECLSGPYGDLDADLAAILLTEIGEAQAIWTWTGAGLRPGLSILILPFIGLGALIAAVICARPSRRLDWLVLLAFCVALTMVMIMQVRGYRLAAMAVLPAAAWLVSITWSRFRARQSLGAAFVAGITVLGFMGAVHWALAVALLMPHLKPHDAARNDAWDACLDRDSYARLASLPPGRVISYLLIGPQILLNTPHAIVTAGYHRNEAGLRDAVRFFSGDEAEARAVAAERGLDYLVFCRGLQPQEGLHGLPPFRGTEWDWLTALSEPDEPLQIYAIEATGR